MNPFHPLPQLTIAGGLAIQDKQMQRWQKLLKPEVFALVQAETVRNNAGGGYMGKYGTGYDVWRGCQIDEFVYNLHNKI